MTVNIGALLLVEFSDRQKKQPHHCKTNSFLAPLRMYTRELSAFRTGMCRKSQLLLRRFSACVFLKETFGKNRNKFQFTHEKKVFTEENRGKILYAFFAIRATLRIHRI